MIKHKIYIALIFTIILTNGFAQDTINRYDENGERHGLWTKTYYKTDQKRYEGVFKHGKEIDSFKYYKLSGGKSVLSAVKVFNENDSLADVTFLSSQKKVISKGKMNGKRFIGQWIYYHKNSPTKMIVENYNKLGELDGERIVYYKNGLIAEKKHYKNGMLNGKAEWFSETNVLFKQSYYINDQLDGKTINYDGSGTITSEGNYSANKKTGIWRYYKEGNVVKEINHTTNEVIIKDD